MQRRSEGQVGLRTSVGNYDGTIVGDYVMQKHSPAANTYFGKVPEEVQEQFARSVVLVWFRQYHFNWLFH